MAGGDGSDTYIVDSTTDKISEAAVVGTDLVQSSATYTLTDNVENLELTGIANINGTGNTGANDITGNDGNNKLLGDANNDTLDGGIGNDTLQGDAGADKLLGGMGDDTYIIDSTDTVTEDSGEGTDTVQIDSNLRTRPERRESDTFRFG